MKKKLLLLLVFVTVLPVISYSCPVCIGALDKHNPHPFFVEECYSCHTHEHEVHGQRVKEAMPLETFAGSLERVWHACLSQEESA